MCLSLHFKATQLIPKKTWAVEHNITPSVFILCSAAYVIRYSRESADYYLNSVVPRCANPWNLINCIVVSANLTYEAFFQFQTSLHKITQRTDWSIFTIRAVFCHYKCNKTLIFIKFKS